MSRVCQAAVSKPEGSENGSYINLFLSLFLFVTVMKRHVLVIRSRTNTLRQEREKYIRAGDGRGNIISLRRKNESERGKRAVSGLQKIKSSDSGAEKDECNERGEMGFS